MSYRMEQVGDRVRIGQMSTGSFDIEVYPEKDFGGDYEAIILPWDHADEVAKHILKRC